MKKGKEKKSVLARVASPYGIAYDRPRKVPLLSTSPSTRGAPSFTMAWALRRANNGDPCGDRRSVLAILSHARGAAFFVRPLGRSRCSCRASKLVPTGSIVHNRLLGMELSAYE